MIDLYLACIKLGVIFVPINILYRDREMAHILTDAEPSMMVAAGSLPALSAEAATMAADRPAVALDGDAPAGIIYTSGTTGASKGAVLTHNNFAANAITLLTCWQISAADRFLLALPLFHVHALGNGLHCWLASGCRMRLLERFEHQKAAATFLDFRPTLFFGVPTIYVRMLDIAPEAAREIGAGMRLFVSGSAPLPAQLLEAFLERFGHTILERYGMSETLMNISNPYLGERRPGSIGLPLPGVSVKLIAGELYLKGPNLFAGYWRREEATRAAFDDGWFRTGDLAEYSPDGYYTLSGRKSDLIISGGFNIYPREIEEFLEEQEGVAEAAVVAEKSRWLMWSRNAPSMRPTWRRVAARNSRPSRCRATSSWWLSCRATRWARSRNTFWGASRAAQLGRTLRRHHEHRSGPCAAAGSGRRHAAARACPRSRVRRRPHRPVPCRSGLAGDGRGFVRGGDRRATCGGSEAHGGRARRRSRGARIPHRTRVLRSDLRLLLSAAGSVRRDTGGRPARRHVRGRNSSYREFRVAFRPTARAIRGLEDPLLLGGAGSGAVASFGEHFGAPGVNAGRPPKDQTVHASACPAFDLPSTSLTLFASNRGVNGF
jgi:malonyl-CoA/methylmalonyl-CoA synthetase